MLKFIKQRVIVGTVVMILGIFSLFTFLCLHSIYIYIYIFVSNGTVTDNLLTTVITNIGPMS
jgi:hypothetical protein